MTFLIEASFTLKYKCIWSNAFSFMVMVLLPTDQNIHESSEELNQDKEDDQRRKKRRRKRKCTLHQDSVKDGAAPESESSTGQGHKPDDEGGEHVSRNKKRKLKKKRHKERLLSMGLMPRAAALEFTFTKDGEVEEGKEGDERRATDVSDFLRTTLQIYMSDCKYEAEIRVLVLQYASVTAGETPC